MTCSDDGPERIVRRWNAYMSAYVFARSPTDADWAKCAMLDAVADEGGYATIEDIGHRRQRRTMPADKRVHINYYLL